MKRIAAMVLLMLGLVTFLGAKGFELGLSGGLISHKDGTFLALGVSPDIRLFRNLYLEGEYFYYPKGGGWSHNLSDIAISFLCELNSGAEKKFVPILICGFGGFWSDEGIYGHIGIGGGFKYRFGDNGGLRFDIRYFPRVLGEELDSMRLENLWRLACGAYFRF